MSEFASELRRPSDRRLSAKLVPTFEDRRCHVVSVTVPYGRILSFLDLKTSIFRVKKNTQARKMFDVCSVQSSIEHDAEITVRCQLVSNGDIVTVLLAGYSTRTMTA
jgi:hypothetical protein